MAVLAAATFRNPRRAAISGLVEGMLAEFWGSLQEGRHKCWALASGIEIASEPLTLTTQISRIGPLKDDTDKDLPLLGHPWTPEAP